MWMLVAGLEKTTNTDKSLATGLNLGIDSKLSEDFNFKVLFVLKSEPNDIYANGFKPSLNYRLSTLWEPLDLQTWVRAEIDFERYKQKTLNARATRTTLNNILNQRTFSVGITQDLSSEINLNLDYSKYTYNQNYKTLTNTLGYRNTITTAHTDSNLSLTGYPKSVFTLSSDLMFIKSFTVTPSIASSTNLASDDKTKSASLNFSYEINANIEFSLSGSFSKTSTSKFSSITVGSTYTF